MSSDDDDWHSELEENEDDDYDKDEDDKDGSEDDEEEEGEDGEEEGLPSYPLSSPSSSLHLLSEKRAGAGAGGRRARKRKRKGPQKCIAWILRVLNATQQILNLKQLWEAHGSLNFSTLYETTIRYTTWGIEPATPTMARQHVFFIYFWEPHASSWLEERTDITWMQEHAQNPDDVPRLVFEMASGGLTKNAEWLHRGVQYLQNEMGTPPLETGVQGTEVACSAHIWGGMRLHDIAQQHPNLSATLASRHKQFFKLEQRILGTKLRGNHVVPGVQWYFGNVDLAHEIAYGADNGLCRLEDSTLRFLDPYQGENYDTVLIDLINIRSKKVDPEEALLHRLLNITSAYPYRGQSKEGPAWFKCTTIYITSRDAPDRFFSRCHPDDLDRLIQRLTLVCQVSKKPDGSINQTQVHPPPPPPPVTLPWGVGGRGGVNFGNGN